MRGLRGFTLIEMMVALLLGAIIITPLYIITRGMAQQTTLQQMETEAMQRSRVGLETLINDFQRAGMMVSPNPAVDTDSIISSNPTGNTQAAYDRQAVVHLNRSDGDRYDSVILVGSFVTSNSYTGYVGIEGANMVTINETFATEDDCVEEFNGNYSFMHLFNSSGQTLDAKVDSAACVGGPPCTCTVTLAAGELFASGPAGFPDGQMVNLAANQAALYRVESVQQGSGGSHDALVRYFVDYDFAQSLPTACESGDITDGMISDFATNEYATARIIAEYVEEFEVWFRPVHAPANAGGTTNDPTAVYHGMDAVDADTGFAPPAGTFLLGVGSPGDYVPSVSDLGCASAPNQVGPEHIRSAMIRLAVRTERTDQSLRIDAPGETNPAAVWAGVTGVTAYNIAPGPSTDVGAYKLRTVITEVPMPNLASKVATFATVPTGW
jgi:prepilin-type N-terminal cleavage/methylation domain-containing protein